MSSPLLLAIEIGGTKLQLGLGRGDGRLLPDHPVRLDVRPGDGAGAIRAQILREFRSWPGDLRDAVAAAGIGFGGPVDADRGRTVLSNQVEGWEDFPLADWVRSEFGIAAVSVHNDADTAALGEARFGAGRGLSPILYTNSGSGIGGGLILDGRIYRGGGQGALEIGHLWIDDPDRPEARTLERAASGWAIDEVGRALLARRAADSGIQDPAGLHNICATLGEAALAGDAEAQTILEAAARDFARGLAHAVTLLAPRRVILGGGVAQLPVSLWLEPIRAHLHRYVFPPFRGKYDVVLAELGQQVVVQGGLALAQDILANLSARGTNK